MQKNIQKTFFVLKINAFVLVAVNSPYYGKDA